MWHVFECRAQQFHAFLELTALGQQHAPVIDVDNFLACFIDDGLTFIKQILTLEDLFNLTRNSGIFMVVLDQVAQHATGFVFLSCREQRLGHVHRHLRIYFALKPLQQLLGRVKRGIRLFLIPHFFVDQTLRGSGLHGGQWVVLELAPALCKYLQSVIGCALIGKNLRQTGKGRRTLVGRKLADLDGLLERGPGDVERPVFVGRLPQGFLPLR